MTHNYEWVILAYLAFSTIMQRFHNTNAPVILSMKILNIFFLLLLLSGCKAGVIQYTTQKVNPAYLIVSK